MSTDYRDFTIATIGSHSALQILRGAKDEGFRTLAICQEGRELPYKSYKVADEIISLGSLSDFPKIQDQLREKNAIVIPHGSFFGAMDLETMQQLKIMYYGNKNILPWEFDRTRQRSWLSRAGLHLPKIFESPEDIDRPVIIKFFGAGGGKGFFLARNPEEFKQKIAAHPGQSYVIQEYVIGAPVYIHYFYSSLTGELEIMSFDKRYESNVDAIGRVAAKDQLDLGLETSYNIMGNVPIVVRESLLPEMFQMGQAVIDASQQLEQHGLFGPFCLETIVTPDLKFSVFEISARIVAGTNPFINGTPYTWLRYNEPMSTGRRIAREIKHAITQEQLKKVLVNDHH